MGVCVCQRPMAEDAIEMSRAFRCSRCHAGAVPVEGSLCLGCRSFLGREASEQWMSEWWQAHPAPEYLRGQQRQLRRRLPGLWTPDPDRGITVSDVVFSEPVFLGLALLFLMASGAWASVDPTVVLVCMVSLVLVAGVVAAIAWKYGKTRGEWLVLVAVLGGFAIAGQWLLFTPAGNEFIQGTVPGISCPTESSGATNLRACTRSGVAADAPQCESLLVRWVQEAGGPSQRVVSDFGPTVERSGLSVPQNTSDAPVPPPGNTECVR